MFLFKVFGNFLCMYGGAQFVVARCNVCYLLCL